MPAEELANGNAALWLTGRAGAWQKTEKRRKSGKKVPKIV